MRFTVLRTKDDSCQICDKLHKPSIANYMLKTRLRVVALFFLRDSGASETRARVKITPREKR